jgi:hypothetical protein
MMLVIEHSEKEKGIVIMVRPVKLWFSG